MDPVTEFLVFSAVVIVICGVIVWAMVEYGDD
jgi:hypothetical protein